MHLIHDLSDGETVVSFAQVRVRQVRVKKNGEPYLRLVLADRSGKIEARIWDNVEAVSDCFAEGDFVKYRGRVERYNDELQVIVDLIRCVEARDEDDGFSPAELVAATQYDIEAMWSRLEEIIRTETRRDCVRNLLLQVLTEREVAFKSHPAGIAIHHDYLGGFLEHVLSVCESALFFGRHYQELDKDLLIAGAVLHDIGKLLEIESARNPTFTTAGRLIGHIVLGRDILREAAAKQPAFPPSLLMMLEHIVLSHQGQLEWGSPKEPMIPEALVLHYIDDLDAKLNRFMRLISEAPDEATFTLYDRYLERPVYRGGYDAEEPEDTPGTP